MNQRELEFIWGIKSYDDLSDRPTDLYTMNDFDIYYDPETKRYNYSVETIYLFKDDDSRVEYLKEIFKALTKWMRKKGYDTNRKPALYNVFSEDNYREGFDTIEELYADFKLKCMGFALMHSKKKGKNRED